MDATLEGPPGTARLRKRAAKLRDIFADYAASVEVPSIPPARPSPVFLFVFVWLGLQTESTASGEIGVRFWRLPSFGWFQRQRTRCVLFLRLPCFGWSQKEPKRSHGFVQGSPILRKTRIQSLFSSANRFLWVFLACSTLFNGGCSIFKPQ